MALESTAQGAQTLLKKISTVEAFISLEYQIKNIVTST